MSTAFLEINSKITRVHMLRERSLTKANNVLLYFGLKLYRYMPPPPPMQSGRCSRMRNQKLPPGRRLWSADRQSCYGITLHIRTPLNHPARPPVRHTLPKQLSIKSRFCCTATYVHVARWPKKRKILPLTPRYVCLYLPPTLLVCPPL